MNDHVGDRESDLYKRAYAEGERAELGRVIVLLEMLFHTPDSGTVIPALGNLLMSLRARAVRMGGLRPFGDAAHGPAPEGPEIKT